PQKQFTGTTLILPDNYEKLFGNFAVQLQSKFVRIKGSELVYIKDKPIFEEHFMIYSTHKEDVLNYLYPDLLDNILWIRNKYKSEIAISFKEDSVYLAIPF